MVLGTQAQAPEALTRWSPPRYTSAEFSMMDAGMVRHDCRTATTARILRPELAQHYLPTPFSPRSTPAPPSLPYHASVSYGGYDPSSPQPMLDAPFKSQEGPERQPRVLPVVESPVDGGFQQHMDGLPPTASDPPSTKTITQSAQGQGLLIYQCNTPLDKLVRTIEAKSEILIPLDQAESVQADEEKEGKNTRRGHSKRKRKRLCCDIPGCSKVFAQKNNLDAHRRTHTGERPYRANLKTHINRHIGARPHQCPHCPMRFPQPSNVKTHMKTHMRMELRENWVCRFGDCNKVFTAKGNLKTHQNTFHAAEIEAFNAKLAAVKNGAKLSDEDNEMAKYLKDVHSFANKGIKGRGKGHKVQRLPMLHLPQQQQQLASLATATATTTATTTVYGTAYATAYLMSPLTHGLPHAASTPTTLCRNNNNNNNNTMLTTTASRSTAPSTPTRYSISRPPNMIMFGGGSDLAINTCDARLHAHI